MPGKIIITLDPSAEDKPATWFNQLVVDYVAGATCVVAINQNDLDWLAYLDGYGAFDCCDSDCTGTHITWAKPATMAEEAWDA